MTPRQNADLIELFATISRIGDATGNLVLAQRASVMAGKTMNLPVDITSAAATVNEDSPWAR